MKILKTLIVFICTTLTITGVAKEVTLSTEDNFQLKADYFAPKNNSNRAVLMLHQCNFNRSMYDNIGADLAQRGIHAFSLDFRGFGDSISAQVDAEKLMELPEEERRKAWRAIGEHWPKDTQLAYDYLSKKVGQQGMIGVIGASCGGGQAIKLAKQNAIKAVSFFSSAQGEKNLRKYKKRLSEQATLIIAAEDDGRTYTSAKQIFEHARHQNTRFISYKGSGHGYPLLAQDDTLALTIVEWFEQNLAD